MKTNNKFNSDNLNELNKDQLEYLEALSLNIEGMIDGVQPCINYSELVEAIKDCNVNELKKAIWETVKSDEMLYKFAKTFDAEVKKNKSACYDAILKVLKDIMEGNYEKQIKMLFPEDKKEIELTETTEEAIMNETEPEIKRPLLIDLMARRRLNVTLDVISVKDMKKVYKEYSDLMWEYTSELGINKRTYIEMAETYKYRKHSWIDLFKTVLITEYSICDRYKDNKPMLNEFLKVFPEYVGDTKSIKVDEVKAESKKKVNNIKEKTEKTPKEVKPEPKKAKKENVKPEPEPKKEEVKKVTLTDIQEQLLNALRPQLKKDNNGIVKIDLEPRFIMKNGVNDGIELNYSINDYDENLNAKGKYEMSLIVFLNQEHQTALKYGKDLDFKGIVRGVAFHNLNLTNPTPIKILSTDETNKKYLQYILDRDDFVRRLMVIIRLFEEGRDDLIFEINEDTTSEVLPYQDKIDKALKEANLGLPTRNEIKGRLPIDIENVKLSLKEMLKKYGIEAETPEKLKKVLNNRKVTKKILTHIVYPSIDPEQPNAYGVKYYLDWFKKPMLVTIIKEAYKEII